MNNPIKRQMDRFTLILTLSLTLLSTLAACSAPSVDLGFIDRRYKEVNIGLLAPMTGELSARGDPMRRAAEMAVNEVNNNGGLAIGDESYRINLIIEDTQSTPEEAIVAARRLLDEDVVSIIGPSVSSIAIPVAEMLNQQRMLMIAPVSSNPETTAGKRYIFRIIATDELQGRLLAEFAYNNLQSRRVAIIFQEDDVYSSFLANRFRDVYRDLGGEIPIYDSFLSDDQDVTESLDRIKNGNVDLLFLPVLTRQVPWLVHQSRDAGIDIPLLGAETWSNIPLTDLDAAYNNSYFSAVWSPIVDTEASQKFVTDFTNRYGATPTLLEALTYDAFGLYFLAAEAQGSFAPKSVIKGIASLENFKGIGGTATYLGKGDPIRDMIIVSIQDGEHHFHTLLQP